MKLTRNFSLDEFACKDGTPVPGVYFDNVLELALNLQVIRGALRKPININSSYRTEKHNKSVGGKEKTSQHLFAKAADIRSDGKTPQEIYNLIERLILEGKVKEGGLGLYKTFVHYDIRGTKARW